MYECLSISVTVLSIYIYLCYFSLSLPLPVSTHAPSPLDAVSRRQDPVLSDDTSSTVEPSVDLHSDLPRELPQPGDLAEGDAVREGARFSRVWGLWKGN